MLQAVLVWIGPDDLQFLVVERRGRGGLLSILHQPGVLMRVDVREVPVTDAIHREFAVKTLHHRLAGIFDDAESRFRDPTLQRGFDGSRDLVP